MTRSSGQLITTRETDRTCTRCEHTSLVTIIDDPETLTSYWACECGADYLGEIGE